MTNQKRADMKTCPKCGNTRWAHAMGHPTMCTACCMRRGGCGRHPAVGHTYETDSPSGNAGGLLAPTIAGASPSSSSSESGA